MARMHWETLDDWGWLPTHMPQIPPGQWDVELDKARKATQPPLEKLQVTPLVDWTFRSLLEECRSRGIKAAFMVMPEHSALRGWYTSHTHAVFNGYLASSSASTARPCSIPATGCRTRSSWTSPTCRTAGPAPSRPASARRRMRPLLEGTPLPACVRLRSTRTRPRQAAPAPSAARKTCRVLEAGPDTSRRATGAMAACRTAVAQGTNRGYTEKTRKKNRSNVVDFTVGPQIPPPAIPPARFRPRGVRRLSGARLHSRPGTQGPDHGRAGKGCHALPVAQGHRRGAGRWTHPRRTAPPSRRRRRCPSGNGRPARRTGRRCDRRSPTPAPPAGQRRHWPAGTRSRP